MKNIEFVEEVIKNYMIECGAYNYEILNVVKMTKKSFLIDVKEIGPSGCGDSDYQLIQIKEKLFTLDGTKVYNYKSEKLK